MSSGFLVWRQGGKKDGICKLTGLRGVPDDFELHEGVSRLEGWPPDASAAMSPKFPKDLGLADSMPCRNFLVVSTKAKDFLEGEAAGKIEFLPIKIINHKERVAADDYFVVNPLDVVDCIDKDASIVEYNPIDNEISGCEQLVLNEDTIPPELKIFRLKGWVSRVVIRREVVERVAKAGLKNLKFIEPEEYSGLI